MVGGGYQAELLKEIDAEHLPTYLGGQYEGDPFVPFEFDSSEGGLLHCPDFLKVSGDSPKEDS